MTLNESDTGRTIDVTSGSVIDIRLKESPTTGYRWMVESATRLDRVSERFESAGAIGGEGTRVFQFRASRADSYEIGLKNWREWEGENSVIGRFSVKIIVK